jgi:hypothetical protein
VNVKKSIFLSLALLLPIAVFLFLKFFGKNEFAVEPLFQHEVQVSADCNGVKYKTPYVIPDSIFVKFRKPADSVTLVIFQDEVVANQQEQSIQLSRVKKEFAGDQLNVVVVSKDTTLSKVKQGEILSCLCSVSNQEFTMLRNCVFLLPSVNDAVVIDSKRRIMGQYALTNREDADRLILELKIILKKY